MKFPSISFGRKAFWTVVTSAMVLGTAGLALAAGGGGEPRGWEATDTYRVMNFTVLAVAVYLAARKPVAAALSGRVKGIKEQLEGLEAQKKDAEATLAQYNEKISRLDGEAQEIMDQYIKQGEEAKARILEEAAASAKKLEEQASRNIAHEFKAAKAKLQDEVLAEALVKAEQMVQNSITSDDQDKLVDEYLDKVVA